MGFMNNGRVNIVITNKVLRYTYHRNHTLEGLVTYGEIELPTDTFQEGKLNKVVFLKVINQLVQKYKWKRKKLFFSIPDDTVVIRQMQIPAALTKVEAIDYVQTRIGNSIYLPFENPAIEIDFLDTDETNRNILLFAYPKDKIDDFEEAFAKTGLKPVVADLTSLSVYRYYYLTKNENKEHVLLIHWNNDALILTVFKNDKAIFSRNIKLSVENDSKEEVDLSFIDEYLIEINRIIDFYQYSISKGESQINQLLLCGDYPYIKTVKERLSEQVTIPIHSFEKEELSSGYIDVLGLALKKDV
ncbi:type IV pilus biogenesis protein PilM [Oceanobacillus salinisoli]|uniref:type IV pilus biogenesis protein PilM n=1 Tax=Oceanobacillus salinisoli TaxID=2678611 RepID=UPI0012E1FBF1|nr:pilus assembly protein PilM [Oceanobacillus salinisoli]